MYDWEQRELSKVSSISKGKFYSKKDLINEGNQIILYGQLYTNYTSEISFTNQFVHPKSGSIYSKGNEVIIPASGESSEDISIAASVTSQGIILGSDLNIVTPKSSLNNTFLALTLSHGNTKKRLSKYAQGKTIVHLHGSNFKKLSIKFPSIDEQKKIKDLICKVDNLASLHQESITKTHQIFQIFQSKMSANLEENTPKIRNINYSNQWNQSRLGDIGNTFTSLSGKTKDDFGHGDAEYVPYLNVFNNPIADTSLTDKIMKDPKQNSLQYGDILFTVSSETPNEVGMSSVWLDNRPNVYLNSFCFGFRPVMKYDHLFLANLLRSDSFRKQMYILAQGVSRYNISKIKAMDIKLKLPIYEEQVYIGEFFKLLILNLQLRKKKIKILQELKGEYLRKMFL
nr:restriction endonuclease subunit S [Jeotgalicoccus saudimassiliensis]